MVLRTVQVASAILCPILLAFTLAVWDRPTAFVRPATDWAAENLSPGGFMKEATDQPIVQSANCNSAATLFAACEATMVLQLPLAVSAVLESPPPPHSAIFAGDPNAKDTDLVSRCCLEEIHMYGHNDVSNGPTPTASSCCGKVGNQIREAAGAASDGPGCSCDPWECKCA